MNVSTLEGMAMSKSDADLLWYSSWRMSPGLWSSKAGASARTTVSFSVDPAKSGLESAEQRNVLS